MILKSIIIAILSILLLVGFTSNKVDFILPSHFPESSYAFDENPITQEKIALGRALFYDPILSSDGSISCASCHSPYNAFAHTDHDLSHGIRDQIGKRNAPALFNLAWNKSFMWDGAVHHLDMQALAPIESSTEMDQAFDSLIIKLNSTELYPTLFREAFGDTIVTGERFLKALSQFQLSLISAESKYDDVMQGRDTFTVKEKKGYQHFKKHCSSCHQEPLFTTGQFANNGLPIDTTLNDVGRFQISGKANDYLTFKIPSLRNLKYSYPYMHDGRFHHLREVLDHYVNGIEKNETLSDELHNGIDLAASAQTELLSFLQCLNDQKFVFNPNHQFPRNILLK